MRETYFIHRDPALFAVILQYLRTGRPPLFFDSTTQIHDLAKYAALLDEARHFLIHYWRSGSSKRSIFALSR
ncbi:hypothetical protein GGI42DRAFT_245176 [Trichoderma sp. SZMC 28013]